MRSVQVASFWHGPGAQSSIFSSQFVPLNPVSVQLHSYLHKYTCTLFIEIIKTLLRIKINLKDIIRIKKHFESFYQLLLLYFCYVKDHSKTEFIYIYNLCFVEYIKFHDVEKGRKNIQISQHKKTLTNKTQHTFVNHVNPTTMLYPVINGHINTWPGDFWKLWIYKLIQNVLQHLRAAD